MRALTGLFDGRDAIGDRVVRRPFDALGEAVQAVIAIEPLARFHVFDPPAVLGGFAARGLDVPAGVDADRFGRATTPREAERGERGDDREDHLRELRAWFGRTRGRRCFHHALPR